MGAEQIAVSDVAATGLVWHDCNVLNLDAQAVSRYRIGPRDMRWIVPALLVSGNEWEQTSRAG